MSILDLFPVAVSRIQRHHQPFRGALALLAFVSLAAGSPLRAMPLQSASTNLLTDDSVPGGIQIASPAYGSAISGSSFTIQFNLATDKNADSLSVMVNGNDISSSFTDTPPTCSGNVCTVSGSITDTSVLKPGENLIVATVKANSGNSSSATNSTFSWVASAPDNGGQPVVNYYAQISWPLDHSGRWV